MVAAEQEPTGDEFLVDDVGSPSGPRENVPARMTEGGSLYILGEDRLWHEVFPEGFGKNIIERVLALLGIRSGSF